MRFVVAVLFVVVGVVVVVVSVVSVVIRYLKYSQNWVSNSLRYTRV